MDKPEVYRALERQVVRLIGIPRFLGSQRKADRRHGQHVLDDIIKPQLFGIEDPESWLEWEDDPCNRMPKYVELLEQGAYGKAAEYARQWVMQLRTEIEVAEKYRRDVLNA